MTTRKHPRPTVEAIRKQISYNPETGDIHWRYDESQSPAWLGRHPGKLAGYTHKTAKYRIITLGHVKYSAHCVIWAYMTGEWPTSQVDHRDLDCSNNKWSNLRPANRSQNKANMAKPRTNTSGIKGVSRDPRSGKWRAGITKDQIHYYLGAHPTKEQAADAYKAKAIALFGEFARTE